jgi:hypothetical protein
MKITIPKIIKDVPLADYAPTLAPAVVKVWVNPTRDMLQKFTELPADDEAVLAWYADLLSQDSDPATHWTAEELQQLSDADPAIWQWLAAQCWDALGAHREALQKKPTRP